MAAISCAVYKAVL